MMHDVLDPDGSNTRKIKDNQDLRWIEDKVNEMLDEMQDKVQENKW